MSAWILSIVGVVFLNIMLNAIVSDGKTSIFIKSIFAIVFMYVLVTPIIKLIKNIDNVDYSKYFENVVEDDEKDHIINELQLKLQEYLAKHGVGGVNIEIMGNISKNGDGIDKINVDLSNVVLNNYDKHIDKYKLITKLIMDIVRVSEEQIVYG